MAAKEDGRANRGVAVGPRGRKHMKRGAVRSLWAQHQRIVLERVRLDPAVGHEPAPIECDTIALARLEAERAFRHRLVRARGRLACTR
eukprot:4419235-Prymnesium_polylepis.2